MSALVLPTRADPFYRQTTTLEGVTYVFVFSYNQRCACWYVSIADATGVDIVNGVKLVCNLTLLRKCADPRKPAGDLLVLSSAGDTSPPDLNDLVPGGGRCKLFYITSDWLAQMKAGNAADLLAQVSSNTLAGTASSYGALAVAATAGASLNAPSSNGGLQGPRGLRGFTGVGLTGNTGPIGPAGTAGAFTLTLGESVVSAGTDVTLPKRIGGRSVNPAEYTALSSTSSIVFHALLETTNAANAANLQLVRATGAGSPAVLATLTTSSTGATEVTVDVSTLFRPGQAAGVFFANLYLATASGSDVATCSGSWLEIVP